MIRRCDDERSQQNVSLCYVRVVHLILFKLYFDLHKLTLSVICIIKMYADELCGGVWVTRMTNVMVISKRNLRIQSSLFCLHFGDFDSYLSCSFSLLIHIHVLCIQCWMHTYNGRWGRKRERENAVFCINSVIQLIWLISVQSVWITINVNLSIKSPMYRMLY